MIPTTSDKKTRQICISKIICQEDQIVRWDLKAKKYCRLFIKKRSSTILKENENLMTNYVRSQTMYKDKH